MSINLNSKEAETERRNDVSSKSAWCRAMFHLKNLNSYLKSFSNICTRKVTEASMWKKKKTYNFSTPVVMATKTSSTSAKTDLSYEVSKPPPFKKRKMVKQTIVTTHR